MKFKIGQRVKFRMPIKEDSIVDDTGYIYAINGAYIYIRTDKFGIEIERYVCELEYV